MTGQHDPDLLGPSYVVPPGGALARRVATCAFHELNVRLPHSSHPSHSFLPFPTDDHCISFRGAKGHLEA